jgi:hypothetical protein
MIMNNTAALLDEIKAKLSDKAVFSEDQINALSDFAESLDWYIEAKLENFAQLNL